MDMEETAVYCLLIVASVAGLAVILWRTWMLRWGKVAPPQIVETLTACHTAEDVPKLRSVCESRPSPLGRLLLFAANHLEWPKAENVSSLETAARREVVRLERGLVVLEIIIGIAPLLGLVGTIVGMMTVFNDIGDAGLNNASKLAHGISVILKTTLIGLLIAIPALVAWGYFSKKVEVLTVEMETMCDEFIRRQYAGRNHDNP
ncbi:MAG: MotA/TolQ/ExbB proton channel family protein [Verrucomicrobiota bacterium]|jgi:biopolymer transport protein ExbB